MNQTCFGEYQKDRHSVKPGTCFGLAQTQGIDLSLQVLEYVNSYNLFLDFKMFSNNNVSS